MLTASVTCQSCCTCKKVKDFFFFGKSKNAVYGYARVCKECRRLDYQANPNPTKQRASNWKKNNPEKRLINNRRWREENLEKARKCALEWARRNPDQYAARRARKYTATPKWANREKIKEIYLNCPKGYHVDHIIPLQGKLVTGLHVETNLQYLPAKENIAKGNKYELFDTRND